MQIAYFVYPMLVDTRCVLLKMFGSDWVFQAGVYLPLTEHNSKLCICYP